MGGQSAFGTKAGDTFTKITIVASTIWILVCMVACKFLGNTEPTSVFTENNNSILMPTGPELESDLSQDLQQDTAGSDAAELEAAVNATTGDKDAGVQAEVDENEKIPE